MREQFDSHSDVEHDTPKNTPSPSPRDVEHLPASEKITVLTYNPQPPRREIEKMISKNTDKLLYLQQLQNCLEDCFAASDSEQLQLALWELGDVHPELLYSVLGFVTHQLISGNQQGREPLRELLIEYRNQNISHRELFATETMQHRYPIMREFTYQDLPDILKRTQQHIALLEDQLVIPPDWTFRKEYNRAGKTALGTQYQLLDPRHTNEPLQFTAYIKLLPEGSNVMIMDHSGDRFFGIPVDDFISLLASRQPQTVYLGTCHGESVAKPLSELLPDAKIYSVPEDRRREGFDISQPGSIDQIYPKGYVCYQGGELIESK